MILKKLATVPMILFIFGVGVGNDVLGAASHLSHMVDWFVALLTR